MRLNVLGEIVAPFRSIIAAGTLEDGSFGGEAALEPPMAAEALAGLVGFAALIAGVLIPG